MIPGGDPVGCKSTGGGRKKENSQIYQNQVAVDSISSRIWRSKSMVSERVGGR